MSSTTIGVVSDSGVDTETTCAVCMDEYKHRTGVFYLNCRDAIKVCNHEFCQECIVGWLQSNHTKTCPLCRRSVVREHLNNSDSIEETSSDVSEEDIYIDNLV